ncbi:MAG: adenylate/guanylate cyclase domain-containing protein [Leptolyngbya sp. SIO1D8]|nr:adenylate/guanylate cyclase domain-containing protein [Leptolyngbya sp. SIO1D8]
MHRLAIATVLLMGWDSAGLAVPEPESLHGQLEVVDRVPLVPTTIPAAEQLEQLLQHRRQQPDRIHEIDAEIRDRFLQTRAILVLDMAGFSRNTQMQGIIPTLQAIYHLREIAVPLVEAHDGIVFKVEADNLYAAFDHPDLALQAAEQLLIQLNAINLHASIGIGYGEVLVIGDRDLYGNEMNLASKLGEDIADDDEILLTEAAHNSLIESTPLFDAFTQEISGVTLNIYKLQQNSSHL